MDNLLLQNPSSHDQPNDPLNHLLGPILISIFTLVIMYTISGPLIEQYKINFIHESGVGISLGMIVGLIMHYTLHTRIGFNEEYFFYFLLPHIIFAGSYMLKKRNFFKNFPYISLYGLLGTIVNFFLVYLFTDIVNNQGWIKLTGDGTIVHLNDIQVLIISATLCATDSVAALTMINQTKFPKVYGVIFGEGMLNDAVSIIIFKAVIDLDSKQTGDLDINAESIGNIFGSFFYTIFFSSIIGILGGIFPTLIMKYLHKSLHHSDVAEVTVLIIFGYLSYVICEWLQLSGVLALLLLGIILNHYAYYNVSEKARATAGITLKFLATIAEGFLFIYLGISFLYLDFMWSIEFIAIEFIVIFFARFITVYSISFITYLCLKFFKIEFKLDFFELNIIGFSGLIRGAIAFALILSIDDTENPSNTLLKSTTLGLVLFTTIFLGGIMGIIIKFFNELQRKAKLRKFLRQNRQTLEQNLLDEISVPLTKDKHNMAHTLNTFQDLNQIQYDSQVHKWWRYLDDHYIKPMLIYKFNERTKKGLLRYSFNSNYNHYHIPSQIGGEYSITHAQLGQMSLYDIKQFKKQMLKNKNKSLVNNKFYEELSEEEYYHDKQQKSRSHINIIPENSDSQLDLTLDGLALEGLDQKYKFNIIKSSLYHHNNNNNLTFQSMTQSMQDQSNTNTPSQNLFRTSLNINNNSIKQSNPVSQRQSLQAKQAQRKQSNQILKQGQQGEINNGDNKNSSFTSSIFNQMIRTDKNVNQDLILEQEEYSYSNVNLNSNLQNKKLDS